MKRIRKAFALAGFALLALFIVAFAFGAWGVLGAANLRATPTIPWAVPVMGVVLWSMWEYLGGKGWPRRTAGVRRRYLRANAVPPAALAWSLVAGVLAIIALAGYWILLFRLVRMPANVLPDFSHYPRITVVLGIAMASLVAPIAEESSMRGYLQVRLEREFSAPLAIALASTVFALAHLTHGLLWPKLLVYFLAGLTFGTIAYMADSILASIPVHVMGDVTFFVFVWPRDAARKVVWEAGPDGWFWLHVAQAVVFTVLAVWAFARLRRVTRGRIAGCVVGAPAAPPSRGEHGSHVPFQCPAMDQ